MIEFKDVAVQERGKTILHNVTFTVTEREKVIFYGKSGSGKTTILRTLMGGHSVSEGEIIFNGKKLDKHSLFSVRTSIAYIGQEPVFSEGTVKEALLFPFNFKANAALIPSHSEQINILTKVGLPQQILESDVTGISGGEKQRVAVARALLLKKTVFCIDEVTSALDPFSAETITALFSSKEFTILSVSHDPRWFSIADRFIKIESGTIVLDTQNRSETEM
ncbi:MAG: ATP-binding cassette domain-containing protein [Chitinispirillaceae bacterium]|nr:ATP-binding cassette domain-containing protein [Chitinispirillaceae bacterium]